MIKEYHIYPKELEKVIRKLAVIPRKIRPRERLKIFHKYWTTEFTGVIKVMEIENINGVENYFIRHNEKMFASLTYPIGFVGYELLYNSSSIHKDNIINSKKSYSGAEIKFWFVYNKINFKNSDYKGFWAFVNPNSMNVVADNKYYFVIHDENRHQKFQMILDRSKT